MGSVVVEDDGQRKMKKRLSGFMPGCLFESQILIMIFFQVGVQDTQEKGRGMFAEEHIPEAAVIETAPVIVMSAADRVHLDQTLLHDYIFEWNPGGESMCCMALGYVPVYNHSYASNAEYMMDYEAQTISVHAVRPIAAGEEITINYNGDWNDEQPLWFDVKK